MLDLGRRMLRRDDQDGEFCRALAAGVLCHSWPCWWCAGLASNGMGRVEVEMGAASKAVVAAGGGLVCSGAADSKSSETVLIWWIDILI